MSRDSRCSSRNTRSPSISGSIQSRTTASGRKTRAVASADEPSAAVRTFQPSLVRAPARTSVRSGSSSTTSARTGEPSGRSRGGCVFCVFMTRPASPDAARGGGETSFEFSLNLSAASEPGRPRGLLSAALVSSGRCWPAVAGTPSTGARPRWLRRTGSSAPTSCCCRPGSSAWERTRHPAHRAELR